MTSVNYVAIYICHEKPGTASSWRTPVRSAEIQIKPEEKPLLITVFMIFNGDYIMVTKGD
jgi:hypothetical protein